jgi:hypothetical protein
VSRTHYIQGAEKGAYFELELARYAIDQFEFKALSPANLMKLLDTAPYQGNSFARATVLVSLGRAQMGIAAIEAEVATKTADADWKELLVTAPRRGYDAWVKSAEALKEQLARSNAFERTFYGPSRKASEGCMATLLPDFLGVAKTLDNKSLVAFKESLSTNLIANLMYTRLATCARVDGQGEWSDKLFRISGELRSARGPRMAAYYATFDALSKILADRTKFSLEHKNLAKVKTNQLHHAAMKVAIASKGSGMGSDGKGIVASARPTGDGVAVTFVPDKHQEMSYDCKSTSQIIMFTSDGRPLYYQDCKPAGLVWIDNTAKPMTVPKQWSAGIAPGAVIEFDAEYGDKPTRLGIPRAVYSDKTKTKLVNYLGMTLAR